MAQNYTELLAFAVEQAHAAGVIIYDAFEASDKGEVEKTDKTLVTAADVRINSQLIAAVRERYPLHGVHGEEASSEAAGTDVWVCDPIDGTSALVMGIPTAMFSLAFVEDGVPMLAVVYDTFLQKFYTAVRGGGAYCNGQHIRVSDHRGLPKARIAVSQSVDQIIGNLPVYAALQDAGARLKGVPGLVCRGAILSAGRIDGCLALGAAHDFAAVSLLVTEAGGMATNVFGNDQRYDGPVQGIVMSNGHIHAELVQTIAAYGTDRFLRIQR